jgi:hypothetical protein
MRKYLSLVVLALASQSALACGCSKPSQPAEVGDYVHIFEGIVTSVEGSSEDGVVRQLVTFQVSKHVAGPWVTHVTVSFTSGTTSCDLETPQFAVGEKWLISDNDIYLAEDNEGIDDAEDLVPSGTYSGNYCSLRERLAAANDGKESN